MSITIEQLKVGGKYRVGQRDGRCVTVDSFNTDIVVWRVDGYISHTCGLYTFLASVNSTTKLLKYNKELL